jgi:hypothetical protein
MLRFGRKPKVVRKGPDNSSTAAASSGGGVSSEKKKASKGSSTSSAIGCAPTKAAAAIESSSGPNGSSGATNAPESVEDAGFVLMGTNISNAAATSSQVNSKTHPYDADDIDRVENRYAYLIRYSIVPPFCILYPRLSHVSTKYMYIS